MNKIKEIANHGTIVVTKHETQPKRAWPKRTCSRLGTAALFILVLGLSRPVQAVKVGWHDQMYLQAGDGVDLKRQWEPLSSPVILSTNGTVLPNTGGQNESVTFAQHTDDMVKSLLVNSSVSLDSLVFSGSVGVNFFNRQTFDANDLTFVFTANRDFGDTLYPFVDFSPDFKATVAGLQKSQQGESLHSAITTRYGTHYVHGYQSAAMVSVIYSFHFNSSSIRQQMSVQASASYNGLVDSGSFSTFVDSFFSVTNTSQSMSYQFYSSDPIQSPTNFDFSTAGIIQNMQEFTNLVSKVEAYFRAMDPARGKITGYILDPIQNVPGYLGLLGGFVPIPVEQADYDTFLQAYSALQVWKQRLDSWALQPGTMSWLNAKGQQMVQGKRQDISNYLNAMKSIASNHFTNGAALTVPSDVVNYLANLNDIPLPEMYVMDSFTYGGYSFIFGRIYCGSLDLTTTSPFYTLSQLYHGTNTGSEVTIYYSPTNFVGTELKALAAEPRTHLATLLASEQWNSLTNQAAIQDRTGFFVAQQPTPQAANWSLVIYDVNGDVVDEMPFLSTRSGGTVVTADTTTGPGVSVGTTSSSDSSSAGRVCVVAMQVTNAGPMQSYGTTVSFQLADNFDFAGASGSQGYGSFDPATHVVSYFVGPLLGGASTDIAFQLIPLQAGLAIPAGPAQLTLGEGITNSSPNITAAFAPIQTTPPTLNLSPVVGGVRIDWYADTDRLHVEQTSQLVAGASWSPVTNGLATGSSHRFLTLPVTGNQNYFRLHTY
jgi:hypothetical protein